MVVEVCHDSAEGAAADVTGAGAVSDDVTAPPDFGGMTGSSAAEAAGASAAEDEDAGGGFFGVWEGGESGFEVVGRDAGNHGPYAGGGAAEAVGVRRSANAREADANGGGGHGQTVGDIAEVPLQVAIRHQGENGGAGGEIGQNSALFVLQADAGTRAAAFDAKKDAGWRVGATRACHGVKG